MALNGVRAETDELDTALGELRLEFCKCAQFSGADWPGMVSRGDAYSMLFITYV